METWQFILALLGFAFSILAYFITMANELSWRKTEFIFKQAYLLDSDKDISEAVMILEDRHKEVRIKDVFEADNKEYRYKFDKLFNLLDRLAYSVFTSKTLTEKEMENFGYYLEEADNG